MANVFFNLPMPALNGPGTAVDVSTMGWEKTLAVKGTFPGASVGIEISAEAGGAGVYAPLSSFTDGDKPLTIPAAALWMRTHVRNRLAGGVFTVDADVGSDDIGTLAFPIAMPAGNGLGAPVNVSTLGARKTFIVTGGLGGPPLAPSGASVTILGSLDGTAYVPIHTFNGAGGLYSVVGTWQWVRTNVVGFGAGFAATASVAAVKDPTAVAAPPPVPGAPGDSNCLVYQPGGAGVGPVVFAEWPVLYATLVALRTAAGGGCYTIEFDDSITSPAVIPAGAYDMTGVAWEGMGNGAVVSLAAATSFTQLRKFFNLTIVNNNAVTAPISDVADGDQFFIRRTSLQTAVGAGAIPFIRFTNTGTFKLWLMEGSTLGGANTGPILGITGAPAKHVQLILDASSSLPVLTAIGAGGAGADLLIEAPDMIQVPVVPAWTTAATSPVLEGPMSLRPNPYLGPTSSVAVTAAFGQWLRFDTSSGSFAQPLPSINAAPQNLRDAGGFLAVSVAPTPSTGVVTVTAAAGDTILGLATYTVGPGQMVLFVSNGVSDWSVVGPGLGDRYTPPEQWAQLAVPANVTDQVMAAQVSTAFDTWKAIRAGSIIGMATRLTTPVTAGTLTVHATINGVNSTLAIVHTAGGNPSGGVATQDAGIDTYVAGDLIGMDFTTTAGFTPLDADLESYLQIRDLLPP